MSFQTSNEVFSFTNAFKKGRSIIYQGNILSLWKGHSMTILRVGPYAAIDYTIHDYAELLFHQKYSKTDILPYYYKFLAGSIGGITATILTYPSDVIRIRLALIPGLKLFNVFQQPGSLFHGISATIIGIIPYRGTTWCMKYFLHDQYANIYGASPNAICKLSMNSLAGYFSLYIYILFQINTNSYLYILVFVVNSLLIHST